MARDHGRILCRIWQDKEFRQLPRNAQALYMQLVSQKEINNAGVLPLMLSKWAKGCEELTSSSLVADLAALVDGRFIVVDTDSEEVLVRSFIRNDGVIKQPNVFKNALRCAEAVESELIRAALADELRRVRRADADRVASILSPIGRDPEPTPDPSGPVRDDFENPSETLPEGERVSEPFVHPCGVGEGVGEGDISSTADGWVGGDARASTHTNGAPAASIPEQTPPSATCPRHPNGTEDPCRACQRARQDRQQFDAVRSRSQAEQARSEAEQLAADHRAAADLRARAIDECPYCDADGYLGRGESTTLCDHRAPTSARPSIRELFAAHKAEGAEPGSDSAQADSAPDAPSLRSVS